MSLNTDKTQQIKLYLLEKISQKQPSVVRKTAQNFNVTPATVYRHLNKLERENILQKQKRDEYVLISKTEHTIIEKNNPIFVSEDNIYETRIPLKQYFEINPVSRSQAKRLYSRLEQFKEVTLDFTGLDWIGQGFAHQLFVVFQNEHPEIHLIPTGMTEDVKRMIRHVLTK